MDIHLSIVLAGRKGIDTAAKDTKKGEIRKFTSVQIVGGSRPRAMRNTVADEQPVVESLGPELRR